mgnify:FL=1
MSWHAVYDCIGMRWAFCVPILTAHGFNRAYTQTQQYMRATARDNNKSHARRNDSTAIGRSKWKTIMWVTVVKFSHNTLCLSNADLYLLHNFPLSGNKKVQIRISMQTCDIISWPWPWSSSTCDCPTVQKTESRACTSEKVDCHMFDKIAILTFLLNTLLKAHL